MRLFRDVKAVVVVPLVACAVACAIGYIPEYHVRGMLERTPPPRDKVQPEPIEFVEPERMYPYARAEDERAAIDWAISDDSIHARITNKTEGSLFVRWDRAEFVDSSGEVQALVPISVKPRSTLIKPGKQETYLVFPEDYRGRRPLFNGPRAGWVVDDPDEVHLLYAEQIGQTFRIRLPIQVETVYEYEFSFEVTRIEPRLAREFF